MRVIATTVLSAGVCGLLLVFDALPVEAQFCRCECYFTPHGRRVCHRVCDPSPQRYVPAQTYYEPPRQYEPPYRPPVYAPAPPFRSAAPSVPEIPREVLILFITGCLFAGLVWLVATLVRLFSVDRDHIRIARIRRDTETASRLSGKLRAAAREGDSYIAARAADAYRRGRGFFN